MNVRGLVRLHENAIEKIQNNLCSARRNTAPRATSVGLDHTLEELGLEEDRSQTKHELHSQTIRLDAHYYYQLERLRTLALLTLATLLLQVLLFYASDPPEVLIINSISVLSLVGLVVQVAYATAAKKLARASNWLTILLHVLHPNCLTASANIVLHLVVVLRVGLLVEWQVKSLLEFKPQAARVLGFSEVSHQSRIALTLKALMRRISVFRILAMYVLLNALLAHCLLIAFWEGSWDYSYSRCFEMIVSTFTRVGLADSSGIDSFLKQSVIYIALCVGIAMNAFVVMASVYRLDLATPQENAHRISRLLDIQANLEESSARYLIQTCCRNRQYRRELYLRFQRDAARRKICKIDLKRKNYMQFLTCSYRSSLAALTSKQHILSNMVAAVIQRLKSGEPDPRSS